MNALNSKYKSILWMNVLFLSAGVGFLVYKKWTRVDYALAGAAAIGALEYVVMYFSLLKKQAKEEEGKK